jgi:hypothetical protein
MLGTDCRRVLAGHPLASALHGTVADLCRATVLDVAQAKCQAQVRRRTLHSRFGPARAGVSRVWNSCASRRPGIQAIKRRAL